MSAWAEWRARSPWLSALAIAHGLLLAALLVGVATDPTPVLGISRWIKPAKFAASIAIYLGTMAWFAPELAPPRGRRVAFATFGATMVIEMVLILAQAARGTTSHFNRATLLDGVVFGVMGIAILANTVALAAAAWRAVASLRAAPSSYRLGIALGLVLALAGSAIGGVMIGHDGHTVGAPDGGPGLPFVNWSIVAGDLRVSHFAGLHAMQALPFVGARWGTRAVWLLTAAWSVITIGAFAQAMLGLPLVPVGR